MNQSQDQLVHRMTPYAQSGLFSALSGEHSRVLVSQETKSDTSEMMCEISASNPMSSVYAIWCTDPDLRSIGR